MLNKLELVHLNSCENIFFNDENTMLNIRFLKLYNTKIDSKKFYKFPNLEYLYMEKSNIIFDYTSLKKLKNLVLDINVSLFENIINNSSLETITFLNTDQYENLKFLSLFDEEYDEHLKINEFDLEKIYDLCITNKTLKILDIIFNNKLDLIIDKNKTINESLDTLKITVEKEDADIRNFLNKFPNIKKLDISSGLDYEKPAYTKIKNDEKIIIEKLVIYSGPKITIYCSFENIKTISLYHANININTFPLFNKELYVNFINLNKLSISSTNSFTDFDVINNLYNNIDKCKSLRELTINLINKDIDKKYYMKYIEKLINLELLYLNFSIQKTKRWNYNLGEYSIKELKKIFPNKINDFYLYRIKKYP